MSAAGPLPPRCYGNWVQLSAVSQLLSFSTAQANNCPECPKRRTRRAIRRLWDAAAGGRESRAASAARVARQSLVRRLQRCREERARYSSAATSAKVQVVRVGKAIIGVQEVRVGRERKWWLIRGNTESPGWLLGPSTPFTVKA